MFSKGFIIFILILILMDFSNVVGVKILKQKQKLINNQIKNNKTKRSVPPILFPYNACAGVLMAIAIPLRVPDRNVFVSYNFEANYNEPIYPYESVPGPLVRLKLTETKEKVDPSADVIPENPESRAFSPASGKYEKVLINRKNVYKVLETRISEKGFDGKKCLLRCICESAKHPFYETNGVFGNILHVILTPSTSKDENLPKEYYKAELYGQQENCQKYVKRCPVNLLSLISFIK